MHRFLKGASGSTHNLTLGVEEMVTRIKDAVTRAHDAATPLPVGRLAALKETCEFRVRSCDESAEEEAVTSYCAKRMGTPGEAAVTARTAPLARPGFP